MAQPILSPRDRACAAVISRSGKPEIRVVAESTCTARRIDDASLPGAFGDQRRRVLGSVEYTPERSDSAPAVRSGGIPRAPRSASHCSRRHPHRGPRSARKKCPGRRRRARPPRVPESSAMRRRSPGRRGRRAAPSTARSPKKWCRSPPAGPCRPIGEAVGANGSPSSSAWNSRSFPGLPVAMTSRLGGTCGLLSLMQGRSLARRDPAAWSSSWRRNAWPSAVPCTSTKPPPRVHHHVHVGLGAGVLGIVQVEHR
jgi:hypothetical protein